MTVMMLLMTAGVERGHHCVALRLANEALRWSMQSVYFSQWFRAAAKGRVIPAADEERLMTVWRNGGEEVIIILGGGEGRGYILTRQCKSTLRARTPQQFISVQRSVKSGMIRVRGRVLVEKAHFVIRRSHNYFPAASRNLFIGPIHCGKSFRGVIRMRGTQSEWGESDLGVSVVY